MPRILVVDDKPEVRNVITRFFSKKNDKVMEPETAEKGLEVLKHEKVDAVLLVMNMPEWTASRHSERSKHFNPVCR